MDQELHRDIGRHDEAIDTLKSDFAEMKGDIAAIKSMLEQAKGGWRTLMAAAAIAGAVGASAMKLISYLKGGG